MFNLDFIGRRVLITGGTRGIGLSLAHCILSFGGNVVITGTSEESCSTALLELKKESVLGSIEASIVDFTDRGSLKAFINSELLTKGFDVLVNNAGSNVIKPFETYTDEDYDFLMDLNFRAPWELSKAIIPHMKAQAYGRIVNVASIWGVITKPNRALYTSTKHAIIGLTKTLAVEFGAAGILTNAVSPGFTLTDLTRLSLSKNEMRDLSNKIPTNRMAEPVEISRTIAFLGSNMNSYINGQNITVDGGYTAI
jgi:3-oxoacyl-[acyl-carrier protein] reductase